MYACLCFPDCAYSAGRQQAAYQEAADAAGTALAWATLREWQHGNWEIRPTIRETHRGRLRGQPLNDRNKTTILHYYLCVNYVKIIYVSVDSTPLRWVNALRLQPSRSGMFNIVCTAVIRTFPSYSQQHVSRRLLQTLGAWLQTVLGY